MEVLRLIKKPENGSIMIHLPDYLKNQKQLEIIILPIEERKITKQFDPKEFYNTAHLNLTVDEIAEESQKMRSEWERNF